jgi:hypothetical protein
MSAAIVSRRRSTATLISTKTLPNPLQKTLWPRKNLPLGGRRHGNEPSHDRAENTGYWLTDTQFFQARFPKPKKINCLCQRLLADGPGATPECPPAFPVCQDQWPFAAGHSQTQLRTSGGSAPPSVEAYRKTINPQNAFVKQNPGKPCAVLSQICRKSSLPLKHFARRRHCLGVGHLVE